MCDDKVPCLNWEGYCRRRERTNSFIGLIKLQRTHSVAAKRRKLPLYAKLYIADNAGINRGHKKVGRITAVVPGTYWKGCSFALLYTLCSNVETDCRKGNSNIVTT